MNFFVTGGSRGIGAGIVLEAVRAGHDVAFTYVRNEAAAAKVIAQAKELRADAKVLSYALDVADAAAVERVGDAVIDDFENIEAVVNCAGVNADNLLVSMDNEEWDKVIATNLSGPFYVSRYFIQHMMSNRYGRIINVSSVIYDGGSGQANYAASKAGLHGLTKSIAKEYGRRGITANVLVPGFFDTDMTRETMPEQAKAYWKQYCPVPKGRMGTVEEFGKITVFLASKDAAFINGQVIPVTGGLDYST